MGQLLQHIDDKKEKILEVCPIDIVIDMPSLKLTRLQKKRMKKALRSYPGLSVCTERCFKIFFRKVTGWRVEVWVNKSLFGGPFHAATVLNLGKKGFIVGTRKLSVLTFYEACSGVGFKHIDITEFVESVKLKVLI